MYMSRLAKWAGKLSFVTCSVAGSTGDPHFEIEKKIHRSPPNLGRLRIVLLDDTVLSFKCLVHL